MKNIGIFICFVLVLIFCSACTENKEVKQHVKAKIEKTEAKKESQTKIKDDKTKESESFTKVDSWDLNKIQTSEFEINHETCKTDSLIAPAYAEEERIIFLSYGETQDSIYEYSTKNQTCKVLYKSKGIGNITGLQGNLFWSEYNTKKLSDVEWDIKSLNLSNNKVTEITNGGSYNDTPTPTIKTGVDSVNWIEYQVQGKNIVSKLMDFNINTKDKSTVSQVTLNEKAEREGEYFILQQSAETKDKVAIYKSIFKDGNKKFNISLQENGKDQINLLDQNGVIDFVTNEKYFAYTGEGHLTITNINELTREVIFKTGNKLTTDTPIFLSQDTLVFRYAMNEIILLNLKEKLSYSLTGFSNLVSKPVYSNGYLSYGIKIDEEESEKITFYLVKIEDI